MRPNDRPGLIARLLSRYAIGIGVLRGVGGVLREIPEGPTEPIDPSTRFEGTDLHPKAVFLTGMGVLAGTWLIVLLVYPVFTYLRHERAEEGGSAAAAHQRNQLPPEPRLQGNPKVDLRDFRAWEETQLNSYQWVDRAHQVVSIPIDEAIRIVARRGIPAQPQPPGMVYFDPRAGTRATGFEGKVEPEPR